MENNDMTFIDGIAALSENFDKAKKFAADFSTLMAYYRCAMMEIETKLNVLNEEYSLQYDRNPISTVKTRLKSPLSMKEKLQRRGLPVNIESIEKELNDVLRLDPSFGRPVRLVLRSERYLPQDARKRL